MKAKTCEGCAYHGYRCGLGLSIFTETFDTAKWLEKENERLRYRETAQVTGYCPNCERLQKELDAANGNMRLISDIAIGYDGYEKSTDLKELIDEIADIARSKTVPWRGLKGE